MKALKEKYGESNIPVLDSIGYRQIFKFLHDELNQKELIDEIVLRTRQFARRQVQWFRKEQFDFTVNINDNYSIMETSKSIVDAWE